MTCDRRIHEDNLHNVNPSIHMLYWGPHNSLFNWYRLLWGGEGLKQDRCEIDHSPLPSAEILKEGKYTSALSIRLRGTTLLNSRWCLECAANRRGIIIKKVQENTEWPKKMYTLFTHQYLWNKFKRNFYFKVRV